jgi:hypothetical protein
MARITRASGCFGSKTERFPPQGRVENLFSAACYKKSPGTGAMLCFIGHALMENRSGLIVQGELTLPI